MSTTKLLIPAIGETVTLCTYPGRRTRFEVIEHDGIDMANNPMLVAVAIESDDHFTIGQRQWFSAGQTVEYDYRKR